MKPERWCVRSRKILGRMLRYLWVPKGRSVCNGRRLGDLIIPGWDSTMTMDTDKCHFCWGFWLLVMKHPQQW